MEKKCFRPGCWEKKHKQQLNRSGGASPPGGDAWAAGGLGPGQEAGRSVNSNSVGRNSSSGLQKLSDHPSLNLSHANTRRNDHLSLGPVGMITEGETITKGSPLPTPEGEID